MPFTLQTRRAIVDHVFGPTPMTAPPGRYVSLHTASPGNTGANEISGNGYARPAVTFGAADTSAQAVNTSTASFGATGSGWAQATHFGVWDSLTGGTLLGYNALPTAKTLGVGDTATYAPGALVVTET